MPSLVYGIAEFAVDYLGIEGTVAELVIIQAVVYSGVYALLNAAENALSPKPNNGVGASLEANYYDSEAALRIIYGTIKCGGMQTIPPITYGGSGAYLAGLLTIAGHEINAITDAYFGQDLISSASIGAVTGTSNDGLVSSGKYANLAWIRRYLGTASDPVDFIFNTAVSNTTFPSTFRGRGIAKVATQLKFNPDVFQSVPQQTYIAQGKKCYDPRLDSTQPGGSGSHRVATPSTWAFTSSPALCTTDYLMAAFGGEYDPSEINWPSVMVAANACDVVLTGANTTPDGDQPRYTCNGALLAVTGDQNGSGGTGSFVTNLKLLVDSMLGRVIFTNGQWSLFAGGWQSPNAVPINKNDWVSGLQFSFEQGRDKRFNESHCWFMDPTQNWQSNECYVRENATYVAADGGEVIPFEFQQPMCTAEKEAQRKAEFLLRQSRNQITIAGKLPPRFQGVRLWDTVLVNFDFFGWNSKTFRVSGCTMNPDGSIDVALSEEQSTDWTDLLTAEYNNPSAAALPSKNGTTPTAPTNLTYEILNGSIAYDWDDSTLRPFGTKYRLVKSFGSLTNVNSKIEFWRGDASQAAIISSNNSPYYVQVQAFANSDFSGYLPATFGALVQPNYSPGPTSAWNAYFSPTGGVYTTGPNPNQVSRGATAVVVSPSAPVYSWHQPTSSAIHVSNAGSASVTFSINSLTNEQSVGNTWYCNIVDGANSTSMAYNVSFYRETNPLF